MHAINRTTIRENFHDESRIGNSKIKEKYLDFHLEVESWLERNSPLPVTFDVSHCQPPFFSEYTYSDFAGGLWIKSLSAEFNSQYLRDVHFNLSHPSFYPNSSGKITFLEKYELQERILEESDDRNIIFLAGGNLYQHTAWEIVDREMYDNDKTLIKAHPLTNDEDLKKLGKRYGWNHLINPQESGYFWYSKASTISTTANSELFIRAMIDGKLKECLTKISSIAKSSYFPFFFLWKKEREIKIEETILDSASGFIFSNQGDWKDRLQTYFNRSMEMRSHYQSNVPLFVGEF